MTESPLTKIGKMLRATQNAPDPPPIARLREEVEELRQAHEPADARIRARRLLSTIDEVMAYLAAEHCL